MSLYDDIATLTDVEKLIENGERESESLEYKTAPPVFKPSDRDEVAKDISALANSAGGVMIYGVSTDVSDRTRPASIQPIPATLIDQIIAAATNGIRHPIVGLRWKSIPKGNESVLLIDVPASPMAPHQVVGNYRYYRRQGAESVPMSHDLVELFFGRRQGPVIVPHLSDVEAINASVSQHRAGTFVTVVTLNNVGVRAARHVLVRIVFPRKDPQAWAEPWGSGVENIVESPHSLAVCRLDSDNLLYPGLPTSYLRCRFALRPDAVDSSKPCFFVDIYADEVVGKRFGIIPVSLGNCSYRLTTSDLGPPPTEPLR